MEKLSLSGTASDERPDTRSQTAANLAMERDGHRCILTKTSQPDACHIIPFSINKTEGKRTLTQKICDHILPRIVGLDDLKTAETAIHGKVKASDEAWNILSLSPQLHRWWTQGRWAFKLEGLIPTGQVSSDGQELVKVRLIFHWITVRGKQPYLPVVPSVELANQMLNTCDKDFTPWAIRYDTGRPVLTGDVVDIAMTSPEADKMAVVIKVQWAALQIASMSGAADVPDELMDPFDPGEDWSLDFDPAVFD
ncbi:hypothetical protein CDD82_2736 [Ophiocordyceps australis]|uniref:HNH nuclease domain-containing protein n=1 Tax=Ophiocordyceps australis TaxID=1399860 RepID=A0A2C5XVV2_9HYPO|nr:hypothetical protein CDD82_2736 [Ophiocordyceps australis]